ncbi:MAG: M20/M25/M40 family metallo-hydrolase, partial [Planctomycetaceae bacterium]
IDYTDPAGVSKSNVIGKRGSGSGGLAYFAHSDVVPADDWSHSDAGPWTPVITEDRFYARGSCDMKGSLACMLAAAETFSSQELNHPLYITVTADEEVGYGGAKHVARRSQFFAEMVEGSVKGIIGEPTNLEVVYAHKGSLAMKATAKGLAAHSSQAHGINANLAMIPFLTEMKSIHDEVTGSPEWEHPEFDPPGISWNIGVNDHTHAINITPPQSVSTVYFRPMPDINPQPLIDRTQKAAEANGLDFEVSFRGEPMYVSRESDFIQEVLRIADRPEAHSVCYGTDASAFTALSNLAVYGPGSIEQAHMSDEFIELAQLELGTQAYARLIGEWCA